MSKETVTIEKLVNGGFGLGHLPSNQVVLAQFGLPGENVIVTTQESNKNYIFGKVVQVEKKHPARITPPCQYYGRCGGCNLQHCSYEAQTSLKRDIILDLLERQGVLENDGLEKIVQETIASPAPFHYRQRIRLQVAADGSLGFHKFRLNDIVEIDACLLAQPSINKALTGIQNDPLHRDLLELSTELELQQNPATDLITCIFHYKRKPRPNDLKKGANLCSSVSEIDRLFFAGENFPIVGPIDDGQSSSSKHLTLSYQNIQGLQSPLQLSWEAGGFCQVNVAQNQKMIETVLKLCAPQDQDTVLDLFCGMGNFSIPISQRVLSVTGYEGQGASIRSAKENSSSSGQTNTTFIKQPVHKACEQLIKDGRSFDIVIIDPPRQGATALESQLNALCRSRLVYISCDPATLCRDLASLRAEGFQIITIQPIDMFPQTHHIETIVLLEK